MDCLPPLPRVESAKPRGGIEKKKRTTQTFKEVLVYKHWCLLWLLPRPIMFLLQGMHTTIRLVQEQCPRPTTASRSTIIMGTTATTTTMAIRDAGLVRVLEWGEGDVVLFHQEGTGIHSSNSSITEMEGIMRTMGTQRTSPVWKNFRHCADRVVSSYRYCTARTAVKIL